METQKGLSKFLWEFLTWGFSGRFLYFYCNLLLFFLIELLLNVFQTAIHTGLKPCHHNRYHKDQQNKSTGESQFQNAYAKHLY